jgi:hypothetical protein
MTSMPPCQDTPNLAVIILRKVAEAQGLQRCTKLTALQLDWCKGLQNLDLEGLAALQQLDIRWCLNLHTINLKGVTSLASLTGWQCHRLARMAGLENLGPIDQVRAGISIRSMVTASMAEPTRWTNN